MAILLFQEALLVNASLHPLFVIAICIVLEPIWCIKKSTGRSNARCDLRGVLLVILPYTFVGWNDEERADVCRATRAVDIMDGGW